MPWENFVESSSILPKICDCSVTIQELDSIILVGSFRLRLFCGSLTTKEEGQDIEKHLPF